MKTPQPIVIAATACEKVIVEKDDVPSIIRVVDTFKFPSPPQGVGTIPISCIVILKGGDFVGSAEITMVLVSPDGSRVPSPERHTVSFSQLVGANCFVNISVPTSNIGTSWMEVFCDGEYLTKFPITLAILDSVSS